ncbi:SRPBCC domain-containing protein [Sorangium sp. So ce1036]|uniref:SRPBCC domain-containing protein n=1 Tax=Sorangium sp. So ce1036 TaxID=3133328 RepID=UPI003EFF33C4
MELKFQVQTKIQKPVHEVFDAVYNPKKLSGYFTTGGASGPLDEGTTVLWSFADFDGGKPFPVFVKQVIPDELIAFEWEAGEPGDDGDGKPVKTLPYNTRVEMRFEALGPSSTLLRISESGWKETEKGLQASYGNCQGWMHMSLCLKAYLEYAINLRQGSF